MVLKTIPCCWPPSLSPSPPLSLSFPDIMLWVASFHCLLDTESAFRTKHLHLCIRISFSFLQVFSYLVKDLKNWVSQERSFDQQNPLPSITDQVPYPPSSPRWHLLLLSYLQYFNEWFYFLENLCTYFKEMHRNAKNPTLLLRHLEFIAVIKLCWQ